MSDKTKLSIKSVYDPSEIEPRWQKFWLKQKTYQPDVKKARKPYYNLMMFPYPSAEGLHVGNMYAFTGADIHGRFKRMQGYDVFEPIGLDGFGIHSENYAIKIGRHPTEHAKDSEKHFYEQLHLIGNGFAWDQKLETYDPDYYRWTQWIFVQMYKHGLAYRKKAMVNWCPSCKTVLSDEQVEGGVCERCKTPTTRKETEQWFFKITAYADHLLNNIPKLNWPKKITVAQQNWIGKKEGINITYRLKGQTETITCFTTTPVNFGATFLVVSPEYPLVEKIVRGEIANSERDKVQAYVEEAREKTEQQKKIEEKQKTGVFTGLMAINHITKEEIPVWVSDFVLMTVGTGAVQGCPGHDKRDFEFAKKFGLPIKRVVVGPDGDETEITRLEQVIESGSPGKMVNSDFLNEMKFAEAMRKTMDYFEEKGWGKHVTTYHLRDWLISRQRYWGPPIPMINCEHCGWLPVAEKDLPVLLPDVRDWTPTGDGLSPLEKASAKWLHPNCPQCGGKAKRETDVSDTFLDSAWYFLAYPNLKSKEWKNITTPLNSQLIKKWLPVNTYIGGAEHAVLHLLYSRFVWMCLKDWGYLNGIESDEPLPFLFSHGLLIKDGAKMSKSRGNVVNPDEYINRYGADTLRMYLMFLGPFDQGGDFRDTGVSGMYRFLERIWRLFNHQSMGASKKESISAYTDNELLPVLHRTIRRVTGDIEKFKYNTAIAALMEFTNVWEGKHNKTPHSLSSRDAISVLKLFAPFAPHFTEELYHRLRPDSVGSIHQQRWPTYEDQLTVESTVSLPVQINGKTRAVLIVSAQHAHDEQEIVALSLKHPRVSTFISQQQVGKRIFIPGRLINFVVQ